MPRPARWAPATPRKRTAWPAAFGPNAFDKAYIAEGLELPGGGRGSDAQGPQDIQGFVVVDVVDDDDDDDVFCCFIFY